MLELINIKKDYPAGSETVHALKGIDLKFRESEFVSILGPSGCGKTTMLNIIGGLDKYTEGDLIINGRTTKAYKDRDWDTYRNHSVGFVFQTYNLIPHQSVLQNVELALTLSGVSKAERRKRAKQALIDVGLETQMNKKPSEMSGGQMQRVAIARALVNNPDIILADEPTGALDTQTGIAVMEILKEVSKSRLVVMVTHNPELAETYSTRIIRMLDGVITSDSAPLTDSEIEAEKAKEDAKNEAEKKMKKPSMNFFTSFGLSLKNLFTKKGRTILTSFAGSIGIIGIALIYAVSQGMTTYIDTVQEQTLSSYPLTLEAQHVDVSSLMMTFIGNATSEKNHENDAVYQKAMFYDLVNSLNSMETTENDLEAFKKYIEAERLKEDSPLKEALNGISYTYDMDLLIYTKNVDGDIIQSDATQLFQDLLLEYFGMDLSSMVSLSDSYGMAGSMGIGGSVVSWQEMLPGDNGAMINNLILEQYDLVYGNWPTKYNEIVLVVDENNEVDDLTLYALGLKSKDDIDALANAALNQHEVEADKDYRWEYKDICDMEFKTVFSSDCYTFDEATDTYIDLRETQAGLKYLYDNGTALKVSGIIRANEDAVSTMLTGSIAYTSELTKYIIENSKNSAAVKAQLEDKSTDIFTNLPFKENTGNLSDDEKVADFKEYIDNLDEKGKASAYIDIMSIPPQELVDSTVANTMATMSKDDMKAAMVEALSQQMSMDKKELENYITAMPDEDIEEYFEMMIVESTKMQYAQQVKAQMSAMSDIQLAGALSMALPTYTKEQMVTYYDEVLKFSESSYDANIRKLGVVDLEVPASMNLYATSFENKDILEDFIADYNKDVEELEKIVYTDYVGIMMSSITTIINAITYVLIAFVAISLIVSSIMIGVITLISVQERTKEIGILRAIGASKKNVSSLFNAETVLIGFTSGVIGVGISLILIIPINMVINYLTGIPNLDAILPTPVALILVAISVILTLFAGIIPSRSAAKKDPVVALRSE